MRRSRLTRQYRPAQPGVGPSFQLSTTIVAALAGLLGAMIGGLFTYLGTQQQIESQRSIQELEAQQSKADYLRVQRRLVYADLLEKSQRFDRARDGSWVWLMEHPPPSFDLRDSSRHEFKRYYRRVQAHIARTEAPFARFLGALTDVEILGTTGVVAAAQELRVASSESADRLTVLAFARRGARPEANSRYIKASQAAFDQRVELVGAIRESLGSNAASG